MGGLAPRSRRSEGLSGEDPALVLISGDLRARRVPAFLRDDAKAVVQLDDHPATWGGLGLTSSVLNTTSRSAWRSYADAKEYAYRSGPHRDAMRCAGISLGRTTARSGSYAYGRSPSTGRSMAGHRSALCWG